MEAKDGFKMRIENACLDNTFIKVIFQYPQSNRMVVKRGRVKNFFENAFNFEEIYDGLVTYSYEYIVEIKEAEIDKPLDNKRGTNGKQG